MTFSEQFIIASIAVAFIMQLATNLVELDLFGAWNAKPRFKNKTQFWILLIPVVGILYRIYKALPESDMVKGYRKLSNKDETLRKTGT